MTRAPAPLEDDVHEAVAEVLTLAIADPGVASANGVMWWTVEHRNAASKAEGKRRKRAGVASGIWDIFVLARGTLIGIELKRPGYTPSDVKTTQRQFHANADKCGVMTFICCSVEDVLRALRTMTVPMRGIS